MLRIMSEQKADVAGVIAPPPLILAATLILGAVLDRVYPVPIFGNEEMDLYRRVAAAVLIVAGLALMATFLLAFRRHGTNVPTRKPTTALVTDGPYRFSRNPGYVSMFLVYAGIVLVADSAWLALLLIVFAIIIRYGVVAREERYLERKFGDDYHRYRASVRRWI
jgi:protein-S-isoprenylcysteine O-methyltransferase Ste14